MREERDTPLVEVRWESSTEPPALLEDLGVLR
jgi:hypothetical protein